MTRAELDAAIQRVIDAACWCATVRFDESPTGQYIAARRERDDARADLKELIDVLDHELAFEPELAVKP